MSVRSKIVALLSGTLVFGIAAAAFAVFTLVRAGDELRRVTDDRVPLLGLLSEVTAGHLEQSIRLERALRFAEAADESELETAISEFEGLAAAIWRKLQDARGIAERAVRRADEGRPRKEADSILALVERFDAAHNEYARDARAVLARLGADRGSEALGLAKGIEEREDRFDRELGRFLVEVSSAARDGSARAKRNERRALLVSGALSVLGILVSAVAVGFCVRLVSQIRIMSGLLPMCASCKSIRDDRGYWNQLEAFLEQHTEAEFTHGLCAKCQHELHGRTAAARSRPPLVGGEADASLHPRT